MTLSDPRGRGHRLKASRGPLSRQYQLCLLDLDGVIYRGKDPVEHAADAVTQAAQEGMVITYTTNNPSRRPAVVAAQIAGFGLECRPEQVITSAIVAARMLAVKVERGSKVLVVGGEHLREEVHGQGFEVVGRASENPQAVIMGWFPQIGWEQLKEACFAIEAGARFFCTNRDLTLPREHGITPGIGTFVNAVSQATGKQPEAMAGKPESAMYDVERDIYAQGGQTLVPVSRSLPVGDRLDTDIEAANRGGYDSLLVLTGVSHAKDLLLAGPMLRPTYIATDLRGLNEPHREPAMLADGSFELGGWRAWVNSTDHDMDALAVARVQNAAEKAAINATHGISRAEGTVAADGEAEDASSAGRSRVTVQDAAHSLDALRVACQAAWAYADAGNDPYRLRLPEFAL